MSIKSAFFLLIIYVFFNLNLNGNYFTYKWVFFELAVLAVVSVELYKLYSFPLSATLFYFIGWDILLSIFTKSVPLLFSIYNGEKTALLNAIFLLVGYNYVNEKIHNYLLILLVACCAQVFIGVPFYGFTGNTSLNATLISLMFPLCIPVLNRFNWGVLAGFIMCFLSILKTSASLGMVALIGSYFTYLLFVKNRMKKIFLPVLLILTCPIVYFSYGENTYSFSGRPDVWLSMWKYIQNEGNILSGTGVGSGFHLIQQAILKYSETKKELTPWAHNEILQVFFETGILGLFACAISFGDFLFRSIKGSLPYLVAFAFSYLINCFGNFPHRLAPDTFLILLAIIICYKKRNSIEY